MLEGRIETVGPRFTSYVKVSQERELEQTEETPTAMLPELLETADTRSAMV